MNLYPEHLCVTCVHQLTLTYSFKILIETSARKLSEKLYDVKSPDYGMDHDDNDSEEDIKDIKTEYVPKPEPSKPTAVEKKPRLGMCNVKKRKSLYCVECKAPFYSVPSLKRHCAENHPVKNTVGRACECCYEKFDSFRSALLHRKKHYRPYICEDCWEGFDTSEHLSSHKCVKPDKLGKDTVTQCDQCGKSYQPSYIKIHMLTHKEERTYSCKECPKKFKVLKGLHSHVQWAHKRTKNYKCEFCNAMFINSSARSAHVRKIHLREKKHGCKCGKGFFSKSELERHMLTHTGVKNYHCHLCEKAYQTRHGLNVHLKSHSQMSMNAINM